DILALPPGITAGEPVELTAPTTRGPAPLRLMIRVIDNGDRFVATQDLRQTQAYAAELMHAIYWTAALVLLTGLVGTLALAAAQD
ncbi:hypothetical protein, partial [Salmonella sp. 6412]|uniref:hypothetical protein n=1 Tax=Salmonella sp. 6412 TaxID=3159581 RepID=UPI003979BB25